MLLESGCHNEVVTVKMERPEEAVVVVEPEVERTVLRRMDPAKFVVLAVVVAVAEVEEVAVKEGKVVKGVGHPLASQL